MLLAAATSCAVSASTARELVHHRFKHALGKQTLKSVILLFEFLEPLYFADRHPTVGFAPPVEGVLSDAVFMDSSL
jgi:hypothetical protein